MRWLATLIASVGIAAVDSVDIILKRISALLAASRVSRRKSRCTFEKGTQETSSSVTSRHFHCFRSIPIDVARKVLSFATADELVEFGQCSAHSLSLCREPSHWQQLCAQRIRDLIRLDLLPEATFEALLQDSSPDTGILWSEQKYYRLLLGWRELVARTALHSSQPSLVLLVQRRLFDVTDFLFAHPGSPELLRSVAGCDATSRFFGNHRHSFYALSQMHMFEVEEAKPKNPFGEGRVKSGGALEIHEDAVRVPASVLKWWLSTASCVQVRDGMTRANAPISEKQSRKSLNFCPHCAGACRESAIFTEWAFSRGQNLGWNRKQETSVRPSINVAASLNLIVELTEIPSWDSQTRNQRRSQRRDARLLRTAFRMKDLARVEHTSRILADEDSSANAEQLCIDGHQSKTENLRCFAPDAPPGNLPESASWEAE